MEIANKKLPRAARREERPLRGFIEEGFSPILWMESDISPSRKKIFPADAPGEKTSAGYFGRNIFSLPESTQTMLKKYPSGSKESMIPRGKFWPLG